MSKNIYYITSILFLFFGVFFPVHAQLQSTPFAEEAVLFFESKILVNQDNSIDVTETITYETGPYSRHGLFRDIYPYSSQNKKMSIENIFVRDESGNPLSFETLSEGKNIRIKIGDPQKTFKGTQTYVITYHATQAVGQLREEDEIYWNVTGNEWNIPIYETYATVVTPRGVPALQHACYVGEKGSTQNCQSTQTSPTHTEFSASSLKPSEGLTVAVGFQKGVVTAYTWEDNFFGLLMFYLPWLIAVLLPTLTLIFSLLYWFRKGRDPKGTGVIVPQYDTLDDLTPMEVGGIVNENVTTNDISTEIIYLATRGYITIRQVEDHTIPFFSTADYVLTRIKDPSELRNTFDQKLLTRLFSSELRPTISQVISMFSKNILSKPEPKSSALQETVTLSQLKNIFYKDAEKVREEVLDTLLKKGYYKNLGRMKTQGPRLFFILFMSIWASGFFGGILGTVLFQGNPFPLILGIFLSIVIYGIISHFSPAKTEKGVAAKEYLLGLKRYLEIAEKDRLEFHNAPEKRPEIFEKLLPYAMILGVADVWAKEFEGIYTQEPSWYSGPQGTHFSATTLSHSMSSFSTFAASSLTSAPSSSGGSGGGGSSGGGGGGGGGGGW